MGSKGSSLFYFDKRLTARFRKKGKRFCLVGIDEAGRGPWAGPVVASAVVLPESFYDSSLNDSKKCSLQTREFLYRKINKFAPWSVGIVKVPLIDRHNILQATYMAMKMALSGLLKKNPELSPDLVLVDGYPIPDLKLPQKSVVRGDSKSAVVAAASIMAKVYRDRLMAQFDKKYPQYGFARHKGYGTPHHQENLFRLGPCPIHRISFSPVRAVWNTFNRS